MRKAFIAALMLIVAGPALAQHGRDRDDRHQDRGDRNRYDQRWRGANWRDGGRYDYNRPDNRYGGYDASRYYRDDRRYKERRLGRNDRIYRGGDGQYYCRRSDGTTGLIVGALAGGVLGNALDRGNSSLLGTVLGAAGGGILGKSIDSNNARCR
ncbi:glycine zipper 2TM domain-containing protein [Sphingomonas naphthae]|uniref:17 kDa surface antigen n=1 Tax=Sphingomonas naphthae TaxID=1813468 RepID=A0ABY7TM15_9SPHN|nr:glycine zipper 2TM domain-containing protein [Sphingomonas naphthae]WCT74272.1 glycine zipper 2TM domain-containing protein [Sphingomonas naphthae]